MWKKPLRAVSAGQRAKPSAASALAVLALVLALGGSAAAAGRYLITSTRQIKPSVLVKLTGAHGRRGPPGARDPRAQRAPRERPGRRGPQGCPANAVRAGNAAKRAKRRV